MRSNKCLRTSESVAEGHPDKVCDQISDAVLDEVIKQDPQGRVACETYITMGLIIIGGEITTTGYVDVLRLARDTLKEIGYTHPKYGLDYRTCAVVNTIHTQSLDIAQGVNRGGAGDQGAMIGYACKETPELMPLPIMLAHKLTRRMAEVRKQGILKYLGPDGKSQVIIEYEGGRPKRAGSIVLACQHTKEILDSTGERITQKARQEMIEAIVKPALGEFLDRNTKYYVNETGKFTIGGPQSDTGMTGRKIIMDTYGGVVSHGGGAFCVDGESLVSTEAGLIRIKDMKKEVHEGKLIKTDIHPERAKVWYDNGEMPTIKIKTSHGYELEGSKNQCIRIIDGNGNYVWRRLDKIKKDDWVSIQRKNRLFGEIADVSDFNYQYKKGTRRKNTFNFPKELTEDYAYLMGLLIGDGNCMMEGGIAICVNEIQQKKNVQNLYERLFGRRGRVFGHWAFMGGVELRAYLRYSGIDYKRSWEKEVPQSIFKAPRRVVAAFLRGLFDTDGCISLFGRNKNFPNISLYSTSLSLTKGVQQLLLNFGIVSNIGLIDNRGKDFVIRGRRLTGRRLVYKLRIKGSRSIEIFKSDIGFDLKRKHNVLNSIRLGRRGRFIIPNQRERISRLYKKLDASQRQKDISKIGRFTRSCRGKATKELTYSKLRDFLEAYKDNFINDENFRYLQNLSDMEHFFDKVEKIETSFTHVFDLFIPGSHTFTANGFICHNSGKDPTKVDRSASYMARYIAKNIVATELAEKCKVEFAYVIGQAQPLAVMVDTFGTAKIPEEHLLDLVKSEFDLTPQGIIETLRLRRPIYKKTACYGHFGRQEEGFTWEELDKVDILRKYK